MYVTHKLTEKFPFCHLTGELLIQVQWKLGGPPAHPQYSRWFSLTPPLSSCTLRPNRPLLSIWDLFTPPFRSSPQPLPCSQACLDDLAHSPCQCKARKTYLADVRHLISYRGKLLCEINTRPSLKPCTYTCMHTHTCTPRVLVWSPAQKAELMLWSYNIQIT